MSGATLHIDTSELGEAGRRLASVASRIADATPLMDEIGSMLVASTGQRFEEGISPSGEKWEPSIRVLEAQGNGQTLVDTALLRTSIHHVPGNDSVEVGTNLVYALIHQEGGQAGRGLSANIPARPYLGISAEDEREIGQIINDYLAEALQ